MEILKAGVSQGHRANLSRSFGDGKGVIIRLLITLCASILQNNRNYQKSSKRMNFMSFVGTNYGNKAGMKTHKKTTLYVCISVAHVISTMKCFMQPMQGSLLVCFLPALFTYVVQVHPYMNSILAEKIT